MGKEILEFSIQKFHKQECISKIEEDIQKLTGVECVTYYFDQEKIQVQCSGSAWEDLLKHIQEIVSQYEKGAIVTWENSFPYFKQVFYLRGLHCANCGEKIHQAIARLSYVQQTEYDFSRQKVAVQTTCSDTSKMLQEFQDIVDSIEEGVQVETRLSESSFKDSKGQWLLYGVIFLGLLFLHQISLPENWKVLGYLILYLPVALPVIKYIFQGSLFDEHFLMGFATICAFLTNNYSEAVAVMLFYNIGMLCQNMAVERSRRSIESVISLKPVFATVKREGVFLKVQPEEVKVGEEIMIRPGEKIPLDGVVITGESELDTSNITGESLLLYVKEGDEVASGAINGKNVLILRVTKTYEEGTIGMILDMIENASSKKAPIEKFITRFAKIYTPIVVLLAAVVALFFPLFRGDPFVFWLYRACVFLVISCPCALVLSVPLGIFAGIGAMSKEGIFVKGGNNIETLSEVDTIVFDKTGTITEGKFLLEKVVAIKSREEEVLQYAAYGEQYSSHPIAQAIVQIYHGEIKTPERWNEFLGRGVEYVLEGDCFLVGNEVFLLERGIAIPPVESGIHVFVAKENHCIGVLYLKDKMKQTIFNSLEQLKKLGMQCMILSGDREENVKKVALELGISESYGSLLPLEKVTQLEHILKRSRGKVAFVGDGTNDAPVLTRADVGIALGCSGTDIAVEAADVVLLKDDMEKVAQTIKIARKTKRIVLENIIFALAFKIFIMIGGFFGCTQMWMAVFADVGVACLAVLNSMRILYYRGR